MRSSSALRERERERERDTQKRTKERKQKERQREGGRWEEGGKGEEGKEEAGREGGTEGWREGGRGKEAEGGEEEDKEREERHTVLVVFVTTCGSYQRVCLCCMQKRCMKPRCASHFRLCINLLSESSVLGSDAPLKQKTDAAETLIGT